MSLNMYDVIVLDCDGVIFDSNLLKVEAFENALSTYPKDKVKEFIEFFKNNFGKSRYYMVRYFIEKCLVESLDEEKYQIILEKYGQNCISLYTKVSYTFKFLEFMNYYQKKQIYVASGSDQDELIHIFKMKNIDNNFIKILGSPVLKNDLVYNIVDNHPNEKVVMIGDAYSDYIAANQNAIPFIFMSDYSFVTNKMIELSKVKEYRVINNLGELL